MRHRFTLPALARLAVFWAAFALSAPGVAQNLVRISGTGSALGGMRLVAAAFMKAHPEVKVEVQPAVGSSGGIDALIAGQIDIAVSNRPPRQAEFARRALASVGYARTPFVVAVHRDLGVTALSSAQLAALFAEGAATFPNGQRARPVLRISDATDTGLLKSFSPLVAQAVDQALKRRGMLNADTDTEAADLVESTPGAVAVSTLALIDSERRPIAALTIDGRKPSVAGLADGSYPFFKSMVLITAADAAPPTRAFAGFVQSPAGQAVLRAHGHTAP